MFDSIDGAVRCAVQVQQHVPTFDGDQPLDRRIRFRFGISIGDVIAEGTDLHGEGVNIATRLQAECPAGAVYSRAVRDQVHCRLNLPFEPVGLLELKNIDRPVETFALRFCAEANAPTKTTVDPGAGCAPLPDRPSIAVLPFANLSGDLEQEYFSDGVADDIITELSHDRALFVIARNSSFTYRGRSIDVKRIGRELGVRYVVEGSVRCDEGRVRVSAHLIDAMTGSHVWAQRYDRLLQHVFAVQDEIAAAVASAIRPAVGNAEQRRVLRKLPGNLNAWEAYQRGMWHLSRATPAESELAQLLFRQATAIDTCFAAPFVGLALTYLLDVLAHGVLHPLKAAKSMEAEARAAIAIDPNDSKGHAMLGFAFAFAGNLTAQRDCAERALMLNRNSALGHLTGGVNSILSGRCSEGRAECLMSLRLDPHSPVAAATMSSVVSSYYVQGDYLAAVDTARRCLAAYPSYAPPRRMLVAALGQLGRREEATVDLNEFLEVAPDVFNTWVRHRPPWFRREDHEHLLDGLRKAGWQS